MTNNHAVIDAIKAYLENRAKEDPQFAVTYAKPGKNLDECYRYIIGEARKRGNAVCMTDDEVYGLAVHYYDEDDIKVSASMPVHRAAAPKPNVELTEEEKAQAKEEALRLYREQCVKEQLEATKAQAKPKTKTSETFSPSLFDL